METVKTTADFLDAMRAKLDLPSDGRLGVYLGIKRQHMSRYRTLGGTFDDEMSLRVAEILELNPAYVITCMHYQREKNENVKRVWERMSAQMMGLAASVLLGVCVLLGSAALPGAISPISEASAGGDVYYVKSMVLLLAFVLAAFWAFPRKSPPCDSHK